MNKKQRIIDDESIEAWSRHYDSITWNMNMIFLPAIGALLLYSYDKESPTPVAQFLGLGLVLFALYYSSGFRMFRANLHVRIKNPDLRGFLTNPYQRRVIPQWNLYAGYMFLISVGFTYQLSQTLKGSPVIYVVFIILWGGVIVKIWIRGRPEGNVEEFQGPQKGLTEPDENEAEHRGAVDAAARRD